MSVNLYYTQKVRGFQQQSIKYSTTSVRISLKRTKFQPLRRCRLAEETKIPELMTMARTIRDKLDGIVSFWTFRHISNAKMEGFNNKIRWLIRQVYGFRDREYFKLKIHQLPEISCEKSL